MKKILSSAAIALLFIPGVAFAHNTYNDTITLSVGPNLSQYQDCNNFQECPGFRDALIEALQELLTQLLEIKLAEAAAGGGAEEVDYSDFQDATYQVLSSGNLAGESIGVVPQVSRDIWEDFKKVAPQQYLEDYVSFLRVYYDEDDFSAAYVETDSNDVDKWGLGINLSDFNGSSIAHKKNLIETLIHEFAHILTLNTDQLDFRVSERRCGTYYPGEGCMFKNSYLNQFVDDFWDQDDFDNSEEIEDERDADDKDDIADEYFEDNADDYVTPYSTWHPAEDIAESFAFFVLKDRPTNDDREVDEKLLFFYEYPELVDMRATIRANYQELFNF